MAKRFDPKTPARALRAMMVVMQPKRVKDVRELQGVVEEWEVQAKQLEIEHEIVLDERIKSALLASMLPTDFQDYMFQWTDGKTTFKEMKDKILALAMNRASLGRPMPMEVDRVRAAEWHEEDPGGEMEECDADEKDVNYVGEVCRRCGGHGHYARECPTPKGKGKGKGKGKSDGYTGKGKSHGKGENNYGKGAKDGGGKGFRGECWHCGRTGHRAQDCPDAKPAAEIRNVVEEPEETEVGGVWSIGCVECATVGCVDCMSINTVERKEWTPVGSGYITVDSAAEESVCPKDWGKAFGMDTLAKWMQFANACGGKMNHYGERRTTFKAGGGDSVMGMKFQVSDVQKPLAAVWRIAERGNRVCFGPDPRYNYIENIASGKKINMIRKGGGRMWLRPSSWLRFLAGRP